MKKFLAVSALLAPAFSISIRERIQAASENSYANVGSNVYDLGNQHYSNFIADDLGIT